MEGLSLGTEGLGFIFGCFQKYLGTWAYGVLGILYLLLLFIYRKKKNRFLFLWYPFVLLLTVYNPFLMNIIIEKMGFEAEFYRFFWLLPVTVLLAWGLVETVSRRKAFWKKAGIAVITLALVLVWNRDSLAEVMSISLPDNVYKVEDGLILVSGIIHDNSKEEQPKVALPLEYNLQARQYDPSLKLTIGRNQMLYWLGNTTVGTYSEENLSYACQSRIMEVIYGGQNIDPKELKKALTTTRTDFIVVYKIHAVHDTVLEAGCIPVGETPDAVVYLTRYGEKHNL